MGTKKRWRSLLNRSLMMMLLALLTMTAGGAGVVAQDATPAGPTDVILATTTSTQDSGLLDVLVPMFEEQTGYSVKPIAVGSGAAIKMGENGEADVLLVHSPSAEEEFMAAGYGSDRHMVFYNDFVIVGPVDDPAGIADMTSASDAMKAIAESESTFISRGDDSGTHAREKSLWAAAGIEPGGGWYVESGTGMGETLRIANERDAYTLTDRGTWLALADDMNIVIVSEGDQLLVNVYHVIVVNPERYDTINEAGAIAFADFLLDPAIQTAIGEFGVDEYGEPLFVPCANGTCPMFADTPEASPEATPAG